MNILFYCSEYPPFRSGGIGSVTKIVAEQLAQRGHKVIVAGYYPNMPHKQLIENINGVTIYRIGLGLRDGWLKRKFIQGCNKLHMARWIHQYEIDRIEAQLEHIIKEHSIDIMELTDFYPLVRCKSRLKFRKFSVPTILRIHGCVTLVSEIAGNCSPFYKINDGCHFDRCNHVLAVSDFSMGYIRESFNLSNIASWDVIYNPVEMSIINKTTPNPGNTILFIGRLTKEKGADSLMQAFNICARENPNLRLALLGSGDKNRLLAYVDEEYHNRIEFLGYCNRSEVVKHIDKCSFGCLPSYMENFSMAAMEVMSRNRTLIYTQRASGKELIDSGEDGILVDPDNIEELSHQILRLSNNHTLRDTMADKAYKKILEKYSTTVIVEQLEEYYTNKLQINS